MNIELIITSFVTLFVIVDPIGLTPIAAALTHGMTAQAQRNIALRSVLVAFGILAAFTLFGDAILRFAGISMPAFRMAGGILLFITALDMLFERRTKRRQDSSGDKDFDDPSVFPLGIPLIAGPGSIATVILLSAQIPGVLGIAMTIGVTAAVLIIVFALFAIAPFLQRALGKTGVNVITRLFGMLLAALSVQFVMDGIVQFGLLS